MGAVTVIPILLQRVDLTGQLFEHISVYRECAALSHPGLNEARPGRTSIGKFAGVWKDPKRKKTCHPLLYVARAKRRR